MIPHWLDLHNFYKVYRISQIENEKFFKSISFTNFFEIISTIKIFLFFLAIKQTNVDDVREVLSYYRQHDDPIEVFRENQRKLQEEMAVNEEKLKKDVQSKPILSSMSGLSFMRRRTWWMFCFFREIDISVIINKL